MKRFYLVSLTLLFILIFSGCSQPQEPSSDTKKQLAIKLGMLRIEDNLPFYAAEHDNIFEKKGLNIELVTFNSARERDIALEAGEIQGELADILAAALLKKGGTPVKIVSLGLGATPQEGRFAILAAPESGITVPQQLSNIPIAVSQHTIIHYLAEEMLKEAGLDPAEVKLLNIPDLNLRFEALLAGKDVKAALLPDPLATLAEKSGAKVIVDDTKLKANLSQTVIIFNDSTLEKHPLEVQKILQAYQEAASNLNNHPERYHELILDKARIPRQLENTYRIPVYSPLQLPTSEMVDRVMAWMAGKELLIKPYTYEEIVAPGFIR